MHNDPGLLHDVARATAANIVDHINLREEEIPDVLRTFTEIVEVGIEAYVDLSRVHTPLRLTESSEN